MNGPALLALQTIDSSLDQVEHRRKRLAERAQHQAAGERVAEFDGQLAHLAARAQAAEAAITDAEHQAEALTVKRTRLEAQLKTVIAPREAEALMHEIAILTAKRGELDDAELQAMDDMADVEAASAELGDQRAAADAARVAAARALGEAESALDTERDQILAGRGPARDALSSSEQELYERLRAQHGGVGIAKLEGMRCQGCHLDLSRAEVDAVRALPAGEPGECPQCHRLLVR